MFTVQESGLVIGANELEYVNVSIDGSSIDGVTEVALSHMFHGDYLQYKIEC